MACTATVFCTNVGASARASTLKNNKLKAVRAPFVAGGRGDAASVRLLSARASRRASHKAQWSATAALQTATNGSTDEDEECLLEQTMTVSQYMTSPALSISPDMSVEEAIRLLVSKGISGLPVTDPETKKVLGVVSGYDVIALDRSFNKKKAATKVDDGMFPKIGSCEKYRGDTKNMWNNFLELQEVMSRASAQTVGEIMHDAYVVNQDESMDAAATKVIEDKVHRLTVLDDEGRLVGVLSRGDIMRATLRAMQESMVSKDE